MDDLRLAAIAKVTRALPGKERAAGPEPSSGSEDPLNALSDKQREVLDLLLQHKTSKEISRVLGISPHTVDQRILLARGKLGVSSRGDLATRYRQLLEKHEKTILSCRPIYGSQALVQTLVKGQLYPSEGAGPVGLPVRESTAEPATAPSAGPGGSAVGSHAQSMVTIRQPPIPTGLGPFVSAVVAGRAVATGHRVLPERFDGRFGLWVRLGTVLMLAGGLIAALFGLMTGGMALQAALARLIDQ